MTVEYLPTQFGSIIVRVEFEGELHSEWGCNAKDAFERLQEALKERIRKGNQAQKLLYLLTSKQTFCKHE